MYDLIRRNLTSDLLNAKFRNSRSKYGGHCYVASEAFYHLMGGKKSGYKPMFLKHEGISHWWIRGPKGQIYDLTKEQFETKVPYHLGKGKGFLTKNPSKRAALLISRINSSLN